jgi:hypothetical protein
MRQLRSKCSRNDDEPARCAPVLNRSPTTAPSAEPAVASRKVDHPFRDVDASGKRGELALRSL